MDDFKDSVASGVEEVQAQPSKIVQATESTVAKVKYGIDDFADKATDKLEEVWSKVTDIKDKFGELPDKFKNMTENFKNMIGDFKDMINKKLHHLLGWLIGIIIGFIIGWFLLKYLLKWAIRKGLLKPLVRLWKKFTKWSKKGFMRCRRRIRGGRAERNEYPLDDTAEPADPERDVEQNNTDTIDTFRRDSDLTVVDPTIAPDDEYVEKRRDY